MTAIHSDRSAALRARLKVLVAATCMASLSACSSLASPGLRSQRVTGDDVPTPMGPPARTNRTPLEPALACFGDQLAAKGAPRLVFAVGEVKDYTGKYSISEGNAITQGGSLMVYSALGKIGRALAVAERYDPVIAERELGYTDRRQLGDGNVHEVNGGKVPWLPYFGGSLIRSDYYIVGGITELNYNIRSGGAEIAVNNIGPKARTFTQSVAIDLRIVDTRTLLVVKSVSLTKQFSGYEVGAGVFRFFGSDLFDINVGAKGQEPLQLGIRTALEEATIRLVSSVTNLNPAACLEQRLSTIPDQSADELRGRAVAPVEPRQPADVKTPLRAAPPVPAGATSLNSGASSGAAVTGKMLQIPFEFGDVALGGGAQAVLDQIVAAAKGNGPVDVVLVARDTENWDPTKRDTLTDQRLAAVIAALTSRGIAAGGITVSWRPDRADTSIHRDGPGLQEIVRIQVRSQ